MSQQKLDFLVETKMFNKIYFKQALSEMGFNLHFRFMLGNERPFYKFVSK